MLSISYVITVLFFWNLQVFIGQMILDISLISVIVMGLFLYFGADFSLQVHIL